MPTFHSRPPPIECGWMLTLVDYDTVPGWRWWNGSLWSANAATTWDGERASRQAARRSFFTTDEIQWSLYYPPNARVPESEARVFKENKEC